MQEHRSKKDSENSERRRAGPIRIVDATQASASRTDALRQAHLNLARAQESIYNLVRASPFGGNEAPGRANPYGIAGAFANQAFANAASAAAFGAPTGAFGPYASGVPSIGSPFGVPTWANPMAAYAPIAGIAPYGPYGPTASPFAPQFASPYGAIAAQGFPAITQQGFAPSLAGIAATTFAPGITAFASPSGVASAPAGTAWLPDGTTSLVPACEIADEGTNFVCQIEMPGVGPEQVELLVSERGLWVSATRETEVDIATIVQSDRGSQVTLQRAIALPSDIHAGSCKAALRDGVLTVTLPKVTPTEAPQRLEVQAA